MVISSQGHPPVQPRRLCNLKALLAALDLCCVAIDCRPMSPRKDRLAEDLPMPAGYFDLALRHLGITAEAAAALLEGTGVSLALLAETDAEITLGQQLRQLRNANRAFPPGWALDVGRAFQPSTHGPAGIAAISAATLGAAFDVVERACHLRNPSFHARVRKRGDELRLEINHCLALFDEERLPLIETFLLSFQGIVEAILGRPMTEGRFEIAAPAPSYLERYREYFHAEVRFETKATGIVIPASWGALHNPFADQQMYAAAVRRLDTLALRLEHVDYTAAHLEHLITVNDDCGLSLADAARRLGISARTLARRLQEAGTTYRLLRDADRSRRAEEFLLTGTLTVAELAYRLGYQDTANFNRACRRWFGRSPGSIRQKPVHATKLAGL
jgi:AraC-like DNA-binding protein